MQPKIICFTPENSTRLTYILNIIFKDILKLDLLIIENIDAFLVHYQENKTNYTFYCYIAQDEIFQLKKYHTPFFKIDKFLLEKTINRHLDMKIGDWQAYKVGFYFGKGSSAIFPFDLFAWSFYLLSRYEEYTNEKRDIHQRFSAKESIAYQYDFLHLPMINILAQSLGDFIYKSLDLALPNYSQNYQFQASYDIDYMFAFSAKGWKRQIAALVKNALQLDFAQIIFKIKVFLGKAKDPFNTFDYIDQQHKNYQNKPAFQKPIYFMLIGNWGPYDKNIDWKKRDYQTILNKIAAQYTVGLHPSYQSNYLALEQGLLMEQKRLAHFIVAPYNSRQHFLKLNFPQTYQNLLKANMQADYSMGYADALGFRASIATPFYWYDLSKEEITHLKVYPFAIMDVTLKNYLKLSPEAAKAEILKYINIYKSNGGLFIPLWHNSSLGDWEGWGKEWRAVYEYLFEKGLD